MKRVIILSMFASQLVAAQNNSTKNISLLTNILSAKDIHKASVPKTAQDSIDVRIAKIDGNCYFLECINGFGGGNIVASIGDEGILLVDDMYASMTPKIFKALKTVSDKSVRIVLNTHFHGDHIQGNINFLRSSIIIAHENTRRNLLRKNSDSNPTLGMLPTVNFNDSLTVYFNGEAIRMIHFPNGHTDGDAIVYFTNSKVLHLGDMFFFEMFPGVYTDGGGNIKQLLINLEVISKMFPVDTHVVPGHGRMATMDDLNNYITMLKETINIVETNLKQGKTLVEMTKNKVLSKYDALGAGGAQTTDQYLSMLVKLLSPDKK